MRRCRGRTPTSSCPRCPQGYDSTIPRVWTTVITHIRGDADHAHRQGCEIDGAAATGRRGVRLRSVTGALGRLEDIERARGVGVGVCRRSSPPSPASPGSPPPQAHGPEWRCTRPDRLARRRVPRPERSPATRPLRRCRHRTPPSTGAPTRPKPTDPVLRELTRAQTRPTRLHRLRSKPSHEQGRLQLGDRQNPLEADVCGGRRGV